MYVAQLKTGLLCPTDVAGFVDEWRSTSIPSLHSLFVFELVVASNILFHFAISSSCELHYGDVARIVPAYSYLLHQVTSTRLGGRCRLFAVTSLDQRALSARIICQFILYCLHLSNSYSVVVVDATSDQEC